MCWINHSVCESVYAESKYWGCSNGMVMRFNSHRQTSHVDCQPTWDVVVFAGGCTCVCSNGESKQKNVSHLLSDGCEGNGI